MKLKFQFLTVLFFLIITNAIGQSHQEWDATYNGHENLNDIAYSISVDNAGNVISAGVTDYYDNGDCLLIKYNSSGETQWVNKYNGAASELDFLNAVTTDDSGNIYVTGNITETDSYWDIVTIKYDADGNQKWVNIINGTANSYDGGTVIATDNVGNCFVGGYIDNSGTAQDFFLLKYNSSGDEIWRQVYNGTGDGNDVVLSIAFDDSLNIYITGRSVGIEQSDDFTTIKYDSSGAQQWVARYNDSSVNWGETPRSVTVDNNGNVYVSGWGADGYAMGDILTIKYDLNGIQQWVRRHHGPSAGGEGAYSVQTDDAGNVYVAGSVNGPYWGQGESDADYVTVKYNSDGDELWAATYNGPATELNWDWITAMKLSPAGDVVVTGLSQGDSTGLDIVTITYDTAGNQQWFERYDGGSGSDDQTWAMALGSEGNIYVNGFSIPGSSVYADMVTIKYSPEITGIHTDQKEITGKITVYPNPTGDIINISFDAAETDNIVISLFDITGRQIKTVYQGQVTIGIFEYQVDMSAYRNGIYLLTIESAKGKSMQKIFKVE
jgi:hypothetical protein